MRCFRPMIVALLPTVALVHTARAEQPDTLLENPGFQRITKQLDAGDRFEAAALMHMGREQYGRAVPILEALVRQEGHENRAELWHLLSVAYNRIDEPADALKTARVAQALQPDLPGLRLESGIAAVRLHRPKAAIDDLEQVTEKWTTSPSAHYYLGVAYAQDDQYEKARERFDRAVQLNPLLIAPANYQRAMIDANEGRLRNAARRLGPLYESMSRKRTPGVDSVGRQLAGLALGIQARDIRRAVHTADVAAASEHLPEVEAPDRPQHAQR